MARGVKTGGRQKGTPNKVTRDIKAAVIEAFATVGGADYLARQAIENPPAFLTLLGKVLPTQITGDANNPLAITEIRRVIVDPNGKA